MSLTVLTDLFPLVAQKRGQHVNLHFCLENGFSAAFDDQLQLEQHMLSEQHTYKSGMDKVKL